MREYLVDREISIGDYVLSGGEIPAMVVVDALVRLLPGAVGDAESIEDDSHTSGLLQFPQYTRPAEYRGWQVPPRSSQGTTRRYGSGDAGSPFGAPCNVVLTYWMGRT